MLKYLGLVFVYIQAAEACDNGWIQHGTSCYHFSHDMEYWTGAFEMCRIIGGYLLEVNNEMENNFIAGQAQLTQREYWLGLTDIVEEGTWVWMKSKTNPEYSNWTPGEPSSTNHQRELENCADMHNSGLWNDVTCTTKKYYVCEQENKSIDIIG